MGNQEVAFSRIWMNSVKGDEFALTVFARVGTALGIGIGALVNTLNLPLYVVGGGVSAASLAFRPATPLQAAQCPWLYDSWTAASSRTACLLAWDDRRATSAGPLMRFVPTARPCAAQAGRRRFSGEIDRVAQWIEQG